jgi:hypothetical protein
MGPLDERNPVPPDDGPKDGLARKARKKGPKEKPESEARK